MARRKPHKEQIGLDLWPREHDLPPRWDGLPVQWGEWDDTGGAFICPPPTPDPCQQCGSTRPQLFNIGRIWTTPDTRPPTIGGPPRGDTRHLIGIISAFRCPACGHDSVTDHKGSQWNLDQTDYTEDGSWDVTIPTRPR